MCYSPLVTGNEASGILMRGFTHTIKDPLWGNIPMSSGIRGLLDAAEVRKLAGIKQNGPAYLVYPGAVHTRLSHSIGVYHLGREMMLTLARKSGSLPFTETGLMSFLSACLLHDIGHFPYAHSLKELSVREHEEIAGDIITHSEEMIEALGRAGADPSMTARIIDTEMDECDEETGIYRSILSGTLDPDKLDYLSRDAFFAGIPYGRQDTSYMISSIQLCGARLALEEDALSLVEQILFSKYMMYRSLYWHKKVRGATAMIKKGVVSALRDGVIKIDELYGKDDYGFYSLCRNRSEYAPLSLVESVEAGCIEERRAWKPYEADGRVEKAATDIMGRHIVEKGVYDLLRHRYPQLKEHEAIIDIPEPISFETDIRIIHEDGSISDAADCGMLFRKAGDIFSGNLRKVALYLPSYVDESDASDAFQEVCRG